MASFSTYCADCGKIVTEITMLSDDELQEALDNKSDIVVHHSAGDRGDHMRRLSSEEISHLRKRTEEGLVG